MRQTQNQVKYAATVKSEQPRNNIMLLSCLIVSHYSVYEQLFKTSDILSFFKGICVGHSSTFFGHFGCHKP